MRRRLWMLTVAALLGAFASFFVVEDNYPLGVILGALAGIFVLVFIRAWPHDLDPRERNGKLTINVTVNGKDASESRYSKRAS